MRLGTTSRQHSASRVSLRGSYPLCRWRSVPHLAHGSDAAEAKAAQHLIWLLWTFSVAPKTSFHRMQACARRTRRRSTMSTPAAASPTSQSTQTVRLLWLCHPQSTSVVVRNAWMGFVLAHGFWVVAWFRVGKAMSTVVTAACQNTLYTLWALGAQVMLRTWRSTG